MAYMIERDVVSITEGERDTLVHFINDYAEKAKSAIMDCEGEVWDLQDALVSKVKDSLNWKGELTDLTIVCEDDFLEPFWYGIWSDLENVLDRLDEAHIAVDEMLGNM